MNIFCIEQNYFAHKREQHNKISREPEIFVKLQNVLLQPGAPFSYPRYANELYCGCELVLRICQNGKDIQETLASTFYDSISVGINFTDLNKRDELIEADLSWEKAKAWDNSSIAGQWVPAVNFTNKNDINFCLYKNRALLQLGNSGLMVHKFDILISRISRTFPINIGDLIFTGTPSRNW